MTVHKTRGSLDASDMPIFQGALCFQKLKVLSEGKAPSEGTRDSGTLSTRKSRGDGGITGILSIRKFDCSGSEAIGRIVPRSSKGSLCSETILETLICVVHCRRPA